MKKVNDKDIEVFVSLLESLDFENCKAKRGEAKSGGYKLFKTNFKKNVNKSNLEGNGVKFIIPSNIVGNYTRLEILLGLKLSGQTDTLTELVT